MCVYNLSSHIKFHTPSYSVPDTNRQSQYRFRGVAILLFWSAQNITTKQRLYSQTSIHMFINMVKLVKMLLVRHKQIHLIQICHETYFLIKYG